MAQEITVADVAPLLELGLSKVWSNTLETTPETWQFWLRSRTAQRWVDYEMVTSGTGAAASKPPGSPFQQDRIFISPKKSFELVPFGLALVIQHEVIKYEWYNVIAPLAGGLAKGCRNRYEVVAYGFLNRAFDTSDSVYTDVQGEAMCSTAHTRLDGGTWKNRSSNDEGLSMTGVEQMWEDLRLLQNHRGFYADVEPKVLMVPVQLRWLANTLTKSEYDPTSANRAYNNVSALSLTVKDSPYITDANFWFGFCSKETYKIFMGLGESPDLKTTPVPATRSMMSTSYLSLRAELVEAQGTWGSRGQ